MTQNSLSLVDPTLTSNSRIDIPKLIKDLRSLAEAFDLGLNLSTPALFALGETLVATMNIINLKLDELLQDQKGIKPTSNKN
jgi:hypothetical protein